MSLADFNARIAICLRCEHSRGCQGKCPCRLDGAAIEDHATQAVCPDGRYGEKRTLPPHTPVPVLVDVVAARLAICEKCDRYSSLGVKGTCLECGCELENRTKTGTCPLHRWKE